MLNTNDRDMSIWTNLQYILSFFSCLHFCIIYRAYLREFPLAYFSNFNVGANLFFIPCSRNNSSYSFIVILNLRTFGILGKGPQSKSASRSQRIFPPPPSVDLHRHPSRTVSEFSRRLPHRRLEKFNISINIKTLAIPQDPGYRDDCVPRRAPPRPRD